jgi:hypothetical protein
MGVFCIYSLDLRVQTLFPSVFPLKLDNCSISRNFLIILDVLIKGNLLEKSWNLNRVYEVL